MLRAGAAIGLVIASWLTMLPTGATAQTAEAVFERVSRSVVRIDDLESHGTGIVIDPDGLILTNYHVVAVALDLSVTARVVRGGKLETATFEEVELVGVHPEYDLALLKIKAPGERFVPATLAPQRAARTGETCYVIGNPGGAEGALDNSISDGLISAAARTIEGLDYIQTNAAINPGNSGGPLVSRTGAVLGVVTFKLDQAEGIGFAIPVAAYEKKAFKPASERPGDPEAAAEYTQAATRFFEAAKRTPDPQRAAFLMTMAATGYRLAVMADPTNPRHYYHTGVSFWNGGVKDVGVAYLRRSRQIDPDFGPPCKLLGLYALEQNDPEQAMQLWEQGLTLAENTEQERAGCAENMAVNYANRGIWPQAAYLASWAIDLHDQPDRRAQRLRIIQQAKNAINREQARHLRQLPTFTLEDMATFVALQGEALMSAEASTARPTEPTPKVTAPATAPTPRPASASPVSAPVVQASPTHPPLENQKAARYQRIEAAIQKPTPVREAGLSQALDGRPVEVVPCYSGLYLAVRFEEPNRIDLFNLHDGRRVLQIPLKEPGAVFGAGGDTLFIYYQKARVIERWDLNELKMSGAERLTLDGVVTHMVFGLENPYRAIISSAASTDALGRRWFALLDTEELQLVTEPQALRIGSSYRDRVHVRANHDLTYAAAWSSSRSPQGVSKLSIGRGSLDEAYGHDSRGTLGMSWDTMLFTSSGWVMDFEGADVDPPRNRGKLFPVLDTEDFHLKLVDGEKREDPQTVQIIVTRSNSAAREFPLPFKLEENNWSGDGMTIDRSILAFARVNRLALIHPENRTLVLLPLGLPEDAAPTASDVADAKPGADWSRKVRFGEADELALIDGPPGLTLDTAARTLRWSVPANAEPGVKEVLLLVTKADGSAAYEREYVRVSK